MRSGPDGTKCHKDPCFRLFQMSVTTEFVQELEAIKGRVPRPPRAVVTAGMPYANGPLHIGHLAGAHVPADIYARWLRMLIGHENVIFVCGTDDHGSVAELAAHEAGIPIREFIDRHFNRLAWLFGILLVGGFLMLTWIR